MPEPTPEHHEEAQAASNAGSPDPSFEVVMLPQPLFAFGQVALTPGALEALKDASVSPAELLARHLMGDWGELDQEDAIANDQALRDGERLLSAYSLPTGEKLWVITEWDRSATTLLLPSEY